MQILHRGIFMPAFDRILQLARMEEMDCEFVEVTAHEGARPTHAVWQGRVCAAETAATTFTRSTPAYLSAITRMNAWPNWTPAISPTAAGCTPGTRSPRCIRAQEQRVRGQQLLVEVDNADNGENVE